MSYWYTFMKLKDRDYIVDKVESGFSVADISRDVGCSEASVRRAMMVHGINYKAGRIIAKRRN